MDSGVTLTASDPANMYEEVVRTPLIWTWPSRFPPQTVRNDVVSSYDLLPALCELTGVAAPAGTRSQLSALRVWQAFG